MHPLRLNVGGSRIGEQPGLAKGTRLDTVLVDRGLAPSRERARALILAGQVTVDGQVVSKAGAPVKADARVELSSPDHPYVGRGGVKLAEIGRASCRDSGELTG